MIITSGFDVAIFERATGKMLKEVYLKSPRRKTTRKNIKKYLFQPDRYEVVFRKSELIYDATFREAYDLAKSHPDGYYLIFEDWFPDSFTDESADYFLQELMKYFGEGEYRSEWTDTIPDFVWARRLSADEERVVRAKYGLQTFA